MKDRGVVQTAQAKAFSKCPACTGRIDMEGGKIKGLRRKSPEPLVFLERKTGFEPATPTLAMW